MLLVSTAARAVSLFAIIGSASTARAENGRSLARTDLAAPERSERRKDDSSQRPDDYLLPGAGRVAASVATGVPFLAMGELAYGVGDGFAVGALAGVTPRVDGFGLRPRGVLFRLGRERIELVVPVLYYPATAQADPWLLARPTLSFEHAFPSGARASLGMGVVGASCIESIVTLGREHDRKVMGGVWNTVGVAGALPIGRHTSLFGEVTAILAGVRPAGSDWIGGPPIVVALGVETGL